jgi:MFS family permease
MMAMTMVLVGSGILSPILGQAMERVSIRKLMVAGALCLGAGFIALSFAASMQQILAVYLLILSIATVLCGPIASSALLARWFNKRRGLAMSISAAGAALGGLIMPPLLQYLFDSYSWLGALRLFGAGLIIFLVPLLAKLIVDRPGDIAQHPDGDETGSIFQAQQATQTPLILYLRDTNFWVLGVILGILFASTMGITSNLMQVAGEQGISPSQGAFLLSVFSSTNFIGKLLGGAIADKFNPKLVLSGIILVFGIAVVVLSQSELYPLFLLASAVLGISQGAIVPLWSFTMATLYGAERVGSSMGAMSTLLTPFNFIAPPLFGFVFDQTGSYAHAFTGTAILVAGALSLVSLIRLPSITKVANAL